MKNIFLKNKVLLLIVIILVISFLVFIIIPKPKINFENSNAIDIVYGRVVGYRDYTKVDGGLVIKIMHKPFEIKEIELDQGPWPSVQFIDYCKENIVDSKESIEKVLASNSDLVRVKPKIGSLVYVLSYVDCGDAYAIHPYYGFETGSKVASYVFKDKSLFR